MKYVGADLHKKTIVLCVLDKERNVLQRVTLHCHQPDAVRSFFAKLAASGPCKVVVEATASYEWLAEILDQLKIELVLAHPGKLRLIAESTNKTDKVDAKVLAEFSRLSHESPPHEEPLESPLSAREIEILRLVATGANNQEIANRLYIARGTVKNHLSNILSKLEVKDRAQAVLKAKKIGLI